MARHHYQSSAAIDYQRFATKRVEETPSIAVLPPPAQRKKAAAAKVPYGKYAVLFTAVFCVLGAIVFNYMTVTELTAQNDDLKTQIATLEGEENALNAKKEQMYNLAYVEEYATSVLGMVKLDKSTLEYVDLSNEEQISMAQTEQESPAVFSALSRGFHAVVEYLN